MRFLSDNRAQSIQVGAVLLFGVLIILLSTWQAFVIPNQNEEVEFNHNQEVQQQMTELRTTVNSMPDAATTRSATVDLGLRYPSRTIFRNPPPVSGTIQSVRTEDPNYNVTITNAEPVNEALSQLWTTEENASRYNTGEIEYRPSYNQYGNAPRTIYADSVLYNSFDREDQELPITEQSLIRDDRISLVALNGSFSETRVDSAAVDFEAVSTQTREVEITPDRNRNITLELATRLREDRWEELLAEEENVNQSSISVDPEAFDADGLGLLTVELKPGGEPYRLQVAKVGLGTDATPTEAEYLTLTDSTDFDEPLTLEQGERKEFVLEVRDKYNKPLRSEHVYANAKNSIESQRQTGESGQVRFTYQATNTGTDTVNFSILDALGDGNSVNDSAPEEISVDIEVEGDQSSVGTILPGPAVEALDYDENSVSQGETINITEARFNNTGTTAVNRGGVPVTAGEYYIVEGNVSNPEGETLERPDGGEGPPSNGDALGLDPIPPENRSLVANTTGRIETGSLEPGEYTTFIRGQDTRGIWTNESVDGYFGEPFEVESSRSLTLSAREDPISSGAENIIDITLEDQNGDPLNETVTVTIEDGSGWFKEINSTDSVRTGDDGQTSVTYQSVADDDGTTVVVEGAADEDTSVTDTAEFDVTDGPVVKLEADQDPISPGDLNELTATYIVDGEPVEGATVEWEVFNEEGQLESVEDTTDSNGEATATYNSDEDDAGNVIDVEVTIDGETATETFEVRGADQLTNEQAAPDPIAPGEQTDISAVVLDQFGDEFAGEEITFEHDGEGSLASGSDVSNSQGEVSDVYTAGDGDAGNEVTVTLSAENSPDVDPVTVTFEVRGADQLTNEQANPETILPGEQTDISAVVLDQFGDEFAGEEITFEHDGEGDLVSGSDVSDSQGEVSDIYTASPDDAGREVTVTLSAENSPDVDPVTVTFQVEYGLSMRVDDLSNRRSNAPAFYTSYDITGTHEEVQISAESTESSASDQTTGEANRDGALLEPGFGDGQEFDLTIQVIRNGGVAAERTLTTNADTVNPVGNDDLSRDQSAQLSSSSIDDRSRVQPNDVRYRFDWTVTQNGGFSGVELFVLNRNGNGASGTQNEPARQDQNVDVEPGDGVETTYKIGILVFDDSGVVVDDRILEDDPDGTGP